MSTLVFFGRVFGFDPPLTITNPYSLEWLSEDGLPAMTLRFQITNSNFRVTCELNDFEDRLFLELHRRASDLVRAHVNLVSYASAIGATFAFDGYDHPDGSVRGIRLTDASLRPYCTAYSLEDFSSVADFALRDLGVIAALDDLIKAITVPHETPVYCARAIDGIRNVIAPGERPNDGWKIVQNCLNVDADFIQFISQASRGPRHGDWTRIDGSTTKECTHRAWQVMNRCLHFLKNGRQQLTISEFPLLQNPTQTPV